MKEFFEDNISSMSFTFTVIVLLNAILGYFLKYEGTNNKFLLTLAALIIVLWAIAYGLSLISFSSTKMYHIINLSSTLFTFYVIVILGDLISQTMNSIVSSGFIFIIIYFLNIKRRERLIERLAVEINEGLSEFK